MNWKKIVVLISPLLFVLVTACGGGSNQPPPPPPCPQQQPCQPNANDQAALQDLWAQAQRAKDVCVREYTGPFIQIASQYVQAQASTLMQGQVAGYPPGAIPGQAPQTLPAIPYQPRPIQTQGNECNTQLLNLVMACTTIKEANTGQMYCQRPESQQWLKGQVADIIGRVQQGIQTGANINVLANPPLQQALLSQAAYQGQNVIIPAMGPLSNQIAANASGYFAGLPF